MLCACGLLRKRTPFLLGLPIRRRKRFVVQQAKQHELRGGRPKRKLDKGQLGGLQRKRISPITRINLPQWFDSVSLANSESRRRVVRVEFTRRGRDAAEATVPFLIGKTNTFEFLDLKKSLSRYQLTPEGHSPHDPRVSQVASFAEDRHVFEKRAGVRQMLRFRLKVA